MGRSVLADEGVNKVIERHATDKKIQIGVLIGKLSNPKDYVVHCCATPEEEEKAHSLEKLDDKWIAHHATQVLRMLPGGLNVVGIYAIAPDAQLKANQSQLRQVLYTLKKKLDKIYPLSFDEEITDRILLQVCSLSKKITCRTFDVADPKCSARPADWKYQAILDRWCMLKSSLALNVRVPVPTKATSQNLEKQMINGLSPYCQNIYNSLCLFNGSLRDSESPLIEAGSSGASQSGKKGKKQEQKTASSSFNVKLLHQLEPSGSKDAVINECAASLLMRGHITSRAFVQNKATVQEAQQAVKEDICRSLMFRCQLLCEDLLQNEEEQDPSILYESPIRLFTRLPNSSLMFCDYLFQDEGKHEAADRFREILSLDVNEENIDDTTERVPDENDLAVPERILPAKQRAEQRELDARNSAANLQKKKFQNILGATIGGAVALLAAGISYLYIGQEV